MVTLSLVHYIFIIMTVIILGFLIFKKEIVIPCIMGILLIGLAYTGNVVTSVQILNSAIITSNSELFGIMLVIALVTAMSKAMHTAGIDELMIRPVRKIIRRPSGAFWGIGICMLIVSWPHLAFSRRGTDRRTPSSRCRPGRAPRHLGRRRHEHLRPRHGPFFRLLHPGRARNHRSQRFHSRHLRHLRFRSPLGGHVRHRGGRLLLHDEAEMKKNAGAGQAEISSEYAASEITRPVLARVLAIVVTITFAAIIIAMIALKIQGGDATALVAGAALILTCVSSPSRVPASRRR